MNQDHHPNIKVLEHQAAPVPLTDAPIDRPLQHHHERNSNASSSIQSCVLEEYSEKPSPPPTQKFYRKKKYWIICSILTAIIVVVAVLLVVFVFFPMIAQYLMNQASIDVGRAQITFNDPSDGPMKRQDVDMNSTFFMAMESNLKNTGPFPATLNFHNPINVYYNQTLIGSITLPDGSISGGKGTLNADTPFLIQDIAFFTAFSKDMLALNQFQWRLKGKLDITALSRTATVDLDKYITIAGMGGFPNVTIQSFKLPGDDPNGGIRVELGTVLVSPSPVGVQLGTIKMQIAYDGVNLGLVASENVTLAQGDNMISLKGTLIPQTDETGLTKVGTLFSNYVAGHMSQTQARGISAAPDGVTAVSWLSEGFQSVRLNVGLGNGAPLDVIQSVQMGYLDLEFDPARPYAPTISAPNVVAGFHIPFGFSLRITEVQQELQMANDETRSFGTISVPWSTSTSDQTNGQLKFAMTNDSINAIEGQEDAFDDYTYALTAKDEYAFGIMGEATTHTSTPIGNITLGGIKLNVSTSLHGMQFLNSTPTVINGLDVTGGKQEHMELAINVTMGNPSDFSISTGDVYLDMLSSGVKLGEVTLTQLRLDRGSNVIIATAAFDPKSSAVGQNLLSTFVMGQDNGVSIAGNDQSTAIASLSRALGAISIDTTLPGLKSRLIQGSKLTVLNDTLQTGVVNVQVTIANPFSANLNITSVKAAVTFQGRPVGNIIQDLSQAPFNVAGHTTADSQPLDLSMNLEPSAVALLLRELAVLSHLDVRPLDGLYTMGGIQIKGQENIPAGPALFDGFNISTFVMDAMKALTVDLQLESGLTIGQYQNTLQFSQNDVATATDETITGLIPIVGQPIVQQIVDGAQLSFSTIILSQPTDQGFNVQMAGSITNTGPMAASISFVQPLTVAWNGAELGKVTMETINTQPDVGANFNVSGEFTIADTKYMGEFAAFMINTDQFKWEISSVEGVNVNAIGYTFTSINMTKSVSLGGAQGFKDCVSITSFNLPANDPAGGIQLTTQTVIKNPSQVGFDLAGVGFQAYFSDVLIGPLASATEAVFPPCGQSQMQMNGRMIPQDSQEGIGAVTEVFGNYLSGKNSSLTVKGQSGSGPNGPVGWLTAAFQSLSIENVILPEPAQIPELIPSITLNEMQLDVTKGAYRPAMSSKGTNAQIKNPFGFPLAVSALNMDVEVRYGGKLAAHMSVPTVPATTDPNGLVTTAFSDVPFEVHDESHDVFNGFTTDLTKGRGVTFGMAGMANSIADTAIGTLHLSNISFDVQSSLSGFNNFDGKTAIIKQQVTGGSPDYIEVTLTVAFNNPSNITITVGDLTFDTINNEKQASIGEVTMKDVVIAPGNNTFDAVMHMTNPSQTELINHMVSIYMTNAEARLTISGTPKSTAIESIQKALETVRLDAILQGIDSHLVERTDVEAKVAVVFTHKAKTWVTLNNPLGTSYTVKQIQAGITNVNNGEPYNMGSIDHVLPEPLTVPAGGQVKTDAWPVDIDANVIELLGLIGHGEITIDLQQNVTVQVGDTDGGYPANFYYYQNNVACGLDIQLLGMSLPDDQDRKNSTSSSSSTTTTASASASAA